MNNQPKIWLSSPHMGSSEQEYIKTAFDTNWITTIGENIDRFESDLENYLSQSKSIAVLNSGTSAIHLGLILLDVKPLDEVICQSFTFIASANPIVYLGATPIFVDSEPDTWNICPKMLEIAILDRISKGKKPKAIIAVHLYGMPYKVDEITKISQKYQIPILEDSAEALGSSYKGQKCGTFGAFGVLSFNGNKIITTSGGGALICQSDEIKKQTIHLATQAKDTAEHYQHTTIGYNYRMSNILAGIGRGQILVLEKHVNKRREMNQFYTNIFNTINGVNLLKEPTKDYFSNHWLSLIQINPEQTNGKTNRDLMRMLTSKNIESRLLWKPLHLQPIFKNSPYYGHNIAQNLFSNGLCLPSGSNLNIQDKNRISNCINDFFYTL